MVGLSSMVINVPFAANFRIDMLVAIPVPKDYNPDTQASRDDPALPLPDPPHSDNDPKSGNSADNSD